MPDEQQTTSNNVYIDPDQNDNDPNPDSIYADPDPESIYHDPDPDSIYPNPDPGSIYNDADRDIDNFDLMAYNTEKSLERNNKNRWNFTT